jgi:hypothetical protein
MKVYFFLLLLLSSFPSLSQNEESDIDGLQEQRKKQQEQIAKLSAGAKKEAPASDVPEEIRKMGYNNLNMAALSDERVVHFYQKILRNNPLSRQPRQEVEQLILEKTKNSILNPFLVESPAVLACLADIVKDNNALADLLGIFLRQGSLKLFIIIWLIFIVMTWLLKRIILSDDWPKWRYRTVSLAVSILMTLVNFTAFYKIFEKELSSTVSIISRNF